MKPKLCIECRYCNWNDVNYRKQSGYYILSTVPCLRIPPIIKTNLVNGDQYTENCILCWKERESLDTNSCGEEGKFWEPLTQEQILNKVFRSGIA